VLVSVHTESAEAGAAGHPAPQELVAAFLQTTSETPDDGDLEGHLVVTDGTQTWEPDELNTVTTATEGDPIWLRHRAAINMLFGRSRPG
jgi:hypothetical protein